MCVEAASTIPGSQRAGGRVSCTSATPLRVPAPAGHWRLGWVLPHEDDKNFSWWINPSPHAPGNCKSCFVRAEVEPAEYSPTPIFVPGKLNENIAVKTASAPAKLLAFPFSKCETRLSYTSAGGKGITELPEKLPQISVGAVPAFPQWSSHWKPCWGLSDTATLWPHSAHYFLFLVDLLSVPQIFFLYYDPLNLNATFKIFKYCWTPKTKLLENSELLWIYSSELICEYHLQISTWVLITSSEQPSWCGFPMHITTHWGPKGSAGVLEYRVLHMNIWHQIFKVFQGLCVIQLGLLTSNINSGLLSASGVPPRGLFNPYIGLSCVLCKIWGV